MKASFLNLLVFKETNRMKEQTTHRRGFITTLLGGAAAFGLSAALAPLKANAQNVAPSTGTDEAEKWFAQLEGKKHKMVFDWPKVNNGAALSWALTLMDTYNEMGVKDEELGIVLILRYGTTPLSMGDLVWNKYGFGKRTEVIDPETKVFSKRNIYAKCKTEDDDCFELFQKRGGLICVCSKAIDHSAEALAEKLKKDKEAMKKEFAENVLPGIFRMPSGIWALNRAQELGCNICVSG